MCSSISSTVLNVLAHAGSFLIIIYLLHTQKGVLTAHIPALHTKTTYKTYNTATCANYITWTTYANYNTWTAYAKYNAF